MRIKCWNLGFNAHGLKTFINVVQRTSPVNSIDL
jgi:hypothetical protein